MIICAKFEDPPKNYGSPGPDFIGLNQIRNAMSKKICILIKFFYMEYFVDVIINSVLETEEEEYIWM
jgi:hypothetical protein